MKRITSNNPPDLSAYIVITPVTGLDYSTHFQLRREHYNQLLFLTSKQMLV